MTNAGGPARERTRSSPGVPRAVTAGLVVVAMGWLSTVVAFGFMYSTPVGTERLSAMTPGLLTSACLGLAGMAAGSALLRRRVLSPWLELGVLPAGLAALVHAGVVG